MDEELPTEGLARAAGSNPVAFADLVARVEGRLRTWIALRLGPKLRARVTEDDVLQETLLQAYRSMDRFAATGPGSFRRWLLSVAENRIRDLHKYHAAQRRDVAREQAKARSMEESTLLDRFSASVTSPSMAAQRAEHSRMVAERIEALPAELREVVIARALEERPFKEIAEALGRPMTTVQAQFARALRGLKDAWEG